MRPALLRLLAVGVGVLSALLLAEVALQLTTEPPAATPHPPINLWRSARVPHFREVPAGPEKDARTFRVMVLGDSFTWGWGVRRELTYAHRLAHWLGRLESEHDFQVVNWSHPGWNTWEQWLSVRDQLATWQPDLLVVAYVLNDAESTDLHERARRRADLVPRTPKGRIGETLYRRSRLFGRVTAALENRRMRRALVSYYHSLYESPGWERSQQGLRRLRIAARELDIPLLLVLFPIFDSQFDDDYAYRDLHALLETTSRRLKIPFLDLLPSYEGSDGRELAVVPFTDAHPSPRAHRIAAKVILERMVTDRMIPAAYPDDASNRSRRSAARRR